MRALPQEEGAILHLGFEFRVFRYVDAAVHKYFVLLAAFAAWCKSFVDE
jgi:hypothetical protein